MCSTLFLSFTFSSEVGHLVYVLYRCSKHSRCHCFVEFFLNSFLGDFSFQDKVSPTVPVYNCDYSPITTSTLFDLGKKVMEVAPPHNAIWTLAILFTNNQHIFLILHLLLHVLPGLFIDFLLRILKPTSKLR